MLAEWQKVTAMMTDQAPPTTEGEFLLLFMWVKYNMWQPQLKIILYV
jgi:hypothetical protein